MHMRVYVYTVGVLLQVMNHLFSSSFLALMVVRASADVSLFALWMPFACCCAYAVALAKGHSPRIETTRQWM